MGQQRTKRAWLELENEMPLLQSQPIMNLTRALAAAVLLATLSSCAAPAKVSKDKDANGKKIEYVYYTPTGSSIPIKVRKDLLTPDADDAAMEKKLEEIQRAASGPPLDMTTGK
jgi:hypothetical protein